MRKVGVEEELLLVEAGTGELVSVSARVLRAHEDSTSAAAVDLGTDLEGELMQHMLETQTHPATDLSAVADDLRAGRRAAIAAASAAGVEVAVVGVAPLSSRRPQVTRKPRYERIVQEFGDMGLAAGTLGMHVHVDVVDDEEAVRVVDGLRRWLPLVVALAANSPYAGGEDTGYASWRQQVWTRWPTAGQAEPFGTAEEYHRVTAAMIASGAALDPGMLYLDARLAKAYPTVEIRVADACTAVEDALVVTALCRALVETAASTTDDDPLRSDLLRAAHWRAARHGLAGTLVHPLHGKLVDARDAVAALVEHVAPALAASGDRDLVDEGIERIGTVGGGARRQRQAYERTGSLAGVVADLVARTAEAAS